MKSRITTRRAGARLPVALLLAALLLGLVAGSAAASSTWANESEMVGTTLYRDTFVYDPGQNHYIDRSSFLGGTLGSYYAARGFDRNFRTWAPDASIPVGQAGYWSGCDVAHATTPCPADRLHYRTVTHALGGGSITTIAWRDAYIARACGNFSDTTIAGPTPTVSGVKYEDLNANGHRDAGEPGLSGWTMQLKYQGSVVATTTTGAGGGYTFHLDANDLPIGAGTYQVVEVQRSGWHASQAPSSFTVGLGVGDHPYTGRDFGNYRNATIAGHKFDDGNVDGFWQTLTEPGVAGWTVQLSNGDDDTTNAGGAYSFSVRPGTYTVSEGTRAHWRQTAPGGAGTRTYTVTSGQVVRSADFGNVCLGGATVTPVDDTTGDPLAGMEVRIEEVSVPGILANDPSLPRTTTGTPAFGDLLPGTYRITAFLPDGVFTTDPEAVVVDGRFAIVKQVAVQECHTTDVPLHLFSGSTPGKVTGGVKIALGGPFAVIGGGGGEPGFATSGFEFMGRAGGARGTLEYQDHRRDGPSLHTSTIEAVHIDGDVAFVWGRVTVDGVSQRFRLRLVDAGEPGRDDHYELTLANGYMAGFGETLLGGNVQIHA